MEPCPSPASPFCHSPVSVSLDNHGCRRLSTTPPPKCLVAQGAGAAGPVLLVCRQWDPLGLARRLPSRGAGAWHCVPLLPWRVQCSGRVCAALVAGPGGWGRCRFPRPSRAPSPSPALPAVSVAGRPIGCPFSAPAGTPFHAVCAFRRLGPVAPQVRPACPLCVCVCAPAPAASAPSPPPRVGVARAPRVVLG